MTTVQPFSSCVVVTVRLRPFAWLDAEDRIRPPDPAPTELLADAEAEAELRPRSEPWTRVETEPSSPAVTIRRPLGSMRTMRHASSSTEVVETLTWADEVPAVDRTAAAAAAAVRVTRGMVLIPSD